MSKSTIIEGSSLKGPSAKGKAAQILMKEARGLREQARQKEKAAQALIEQCDHTFDNGKCATETVFITEFCVICGR